MATDHDDQWLRVDLNEIRDWARSKADSAPKWIEFQYQRAKLHAGIKPTALCLAFDKENLIEFPLDSVYYLYKKSNPNPFFYPVLPYESLSFHASIDKKRKEKKKKEI